MACDLDAQGAALSSIIEKSADLDKFRCSVVLRSSSDLLPFAVERQPSRQFTMLEAHVHLIHERTALAAVSMSMVPTVSR